MYNFTLLENENINFISDNSMILEDNSYNKYSIIITNLRLLILNYPSPISNSMEDLRCSQRISYKPKKDIFFQIDLNKILKFKLRDKDMIDIYISKTNYITIHDKILINYLKRNLANKF